MTDLTYEQLAECVMLSLPAFADEETGLGIADQAIKTTDAVWKLLGHEPIRKGSDDA